MTIKNNLIVLKPVLLFNKISTFGLKVGMQIHLIPSRDDRIKIQLEFKALKKAYE